MPAYLAMDIAVSLLSPVTILTTTPALRQISIALGMPYLRWFVMPTMPMMMRSLSMSLHEDGI
jgi:hypothetical protein